MSWTLTIEGPATLIFEGGAIVEVGPLSAGAGGQSPAVDVQLDPDGAGLPAALDPPPLRAAAELRDGAELVFRGLVQAVRLGPAPSVALES